jgi:dCMP deaminase
MNSENWDNRFLSLAENVASWSKDPSTKVGAVIVDEDRRIVSVGFNGFPKGMADDPERYADRDYKYAHIIHAERNALLFASKPLVGCVVYTVPFMPCSQCAVLLVQAGIKRVVSLHCDNERWAKSFEATVAIFQETGVELCLK